MQIPENGERLAHLDNNPQIFLDGRIVVNQTSLEISGHLKYNPKNGKVSSGNLMTHHSIMSVDSGTYRRGSIFHRGFLTIRTKIDMDGRKTLVTDYFLVKPRWHRKYSGTMRRNDGFVGEVYLNIREN